MIYGGIELEQIQLNLDTLWSGTKRAPIDDDKTDKLKILRELIFDEKYAEADKFASENLLHDNSEKFLPLGNIYIKTPGLGGLSHYRRTLNLETAEINIEYARNCGRDFEYQRNMFISYPHNVMVVEFIPGEKQTIEFFCDSELQCDCHPERDTYHLSGRAPGFVNFNHIKNDIPDYYNNDKTISFHMTAKVINDGGYMQNRGNKICVYHANKITVIVAAQTNFVGYDKDPDAKMNLKKICADRIAKAQSDGIDRVRRDHLEDYRKLFGRMSLDLCGDTKNLPTDIRIEEFRKNPTDKGLIALMFQYGRYLTIAGSRMESQPMTLQGIWNNQLQPPWSSSYTANINTEMNY